MLVEPAQRFPGNGVHRWKVSTLEQDVVFRLGSEILVERFL
jgi:hypothetical protein